MLLRSSSTPATETLLSHFSDSPKRDFDTLNTHINSTKHNPLFNYGMLHHHNLRKAFSCSSSSSPASEFNQENCGFHIEGIQRAWSDSNLDELAYITSDKQEFDNSNTPKKSPYRHHKAMLHSAPSFSIFNDGVLEGEEKDVRKEEEEAVELLRTVTIGDNIQAIGSGEYSFGKKSMGLIEEEGEDEPEEKLNGVVESLSVEEEIKEPASPPLYLAAGLGISGYDFGGDGGGGGVDLSLPNFDENGDVEEYYKRMVDQYWCHPLFLTNYAQLLQSKGDLHGAEEYYYRATLADPDDGQILLHYAKLVWELHHDQDVALSHFQRAVQAAPHDSYVLAAYASFLWEIDDDKEDDTSNLDNSQVRQEEPLDSLTLAANKDFQPLQLPPAVMISVGDHSHTTSDAYLGGNVEEYYKRMIEENPCNSLVLRNYAQFLRESKGDLQGAEEYYSRAVQADPKDGEIISQYASLVWELHHDHDKALSYHEQAVQATPEDSYVLAAYASFLWETEEEEEDSSSKPSQFQVPIHDGGATASANA